MNNDDTITIDLGDITPVEYSFTDSGMSVGFTAQEITAFPGTTVTINSGVNVAAAGQISGAVGSSYTISTPWEELEERLIRLEKLIAEEEEVRRTHPAVNQAYNEYRLLYVLAKKNPGDLLTDQ
jgi:hypothetical protein